MPYQIIRSRIAPDTAEAVLVPVYTTRSNFLFGPRVGKITVSQGNAPGKYLFRVVCPLWEPDRNEETAKLKRCYELCLKLAANRGLKSLAIPLPDGQAQAWGLRAALAAIGVCPGARELEIYLLAGDPEALRMPAARRRDLEAYMAGRSTVSERWSDQPFPDKEDKFFTAAPCPMPVQESCAMPMQAKRAMGRATELEELLRGADAGFSETLLHLIDKTGKKDSEIYNKANVSRQHFSKIRNNLDYKPTKPTAIAFAIALELNMDQTLDLIGRAGYTLTTSSKFDLIIMYFIEKKNYDLFDINTALYEFDQSLLGA